MSEKKEDKGQAVDRMQAAALTAATKGLSRAQADKVKAAAARNVNAYGQKEEGPSRWQERKEAKRQMYLRSTEKAVKLGVRKDKANDLSIGGVASQCQKCFQAGHWTYECKNERVYVSRPSRSQLLKNPKLRQKIMPSYPEDNLDMKGEVEEKEEKVEKRRKKSKRKHRSDTESNSDTEASDSGSDSKTLSVTGSDYSSDGDTSSYSSSSESEKDRRKKKRNNKKQKGWRKKYSCSSESSDYDSSSGSDSKRKRSRSTKRSSRR